MNKPHEFALNELQVQNQKGCPLTAYMFLPSKADCMMIAATQIVRCSILNLATCAVVG
jgi:hypothetical protein